LLPAIVRRQYMNPFNGTINYKPGVEGGRGTRWCSSLRHYVTRRKVAGSIPSAVIGIFHSYNPSGRNVVLESTRSLREMITKNIPWGVKAAGAWG
jgi:hypothetical protein